MSYSFLVLAAFRHFQLLILLINLIVIKKLAVGRRHFACRGAGGRGQPRSHINLSLLGHARGPVFHKAVIATLAATLIAILNRPTVVQVIEQVLVTPTELVVQLRPLYLLLYTNILLLVHSSSCICAHALPLFMFRIVPSQRGHHFFWDFSKWV